MISSGILELDDGLVSMGYPLAFNQVGIQIARVFKMHEPKFGQVNSKGNRRGGVDFFFFFFCVLMRGRIQSLEFEERMDEGPIVETDDGVEAREDGAVGMLIRSIG